MEERVIVADASIMNGTPCFRGTRVPFKNLIDYLEGGHPLDEFLRQFPTVTREMAVQALEEAKESLLSRMPLPYRDEQMRHVEKPFSTSR